MGTMTQMTRYEALMLYNEAGEPMISSCGFKVVKHADAERAVGELRAQLDQYEALMELATHDMVFFHSEEYGAFLESCEPEPVGKIAFSILVNDAFYPAADAEPLNISDAIPLLDVYRAKGYEGILRWVQANRGNLPLRPHVERRVKAQEDLRALVESYRHEHSMSCAVWTPGPVDNRCWICKRVDALLAAERYLAPEQAEQKGERKG
jgi:hypothetical protein